MPGLRVLPVALVLSFLLACSPKEDSQEAQPGGPSEKLSGNLYEIGIEALTERRYSEAAEVLEMAAKQDPHNMELFYWLARAYWNREQGPEAIRHYRRVIELDPEGASEWSLYALENVAEVLSRTDRMREAHEAYEKALDRETRPEWISKIKNQLAEIDLAWGVLEPSADTRQNTKGEIIGGVGVDMMRTNKYFEIARHTSDPEKEAKYYRLAIETDPGMYQPYFNLGLALIKLERYEEAIPWLEESERVWKEDGDMNPDRIDKGDAHAFLALCHLELGDLEKAHDHAQRALAVDDGYYWTALYAQRVRVARGEPEVAIPILEGLAEDNPEEPETLHALYEAYAAVGRSEDARDILREAVRVIPENHPWRGRLKEAWSAILR